jgi:hypothetical protein
MPYGFRLGDRTSLPPTPFAGERSQRRGAPSRVWFSFPLREGGQGGEARPQKYNHRNQFRTTLLLASMSPVIELAYTRHGGR